MANPLIDLTTVAIVKDTIGIPVVDTTQDTKLDRIVSAASRRIMGFCDRRFIEETYTDVYNGRRSDTLLLKQFPVSSITSIHIDAESTFGASTLVDATEYKILHSSLAVMISGRRFDVGVANIQVIYTAGYLFANIPEDLQDCANRLVEYMYQMEEERRIGLLSKGKQGENTSYVLDIPEFIQTGLMPYKRPYEWGSNVSIQNS